jgi:pimeloyl-ACP methyl ester carboxylesterase
MACHSTPAAPELHKNEPTELSYNIFDRLVAGISWQPAAPKKAIALHGWLDNAASFSVVGPLLKDIDLCAIDMAGQGLSGYRSRDANYDLVSELRDLYELSKLFSKDPIDLVGHSRGAIVAALFAAIVPEKVNRLVLIDSIEPFPHKMQDLPQALVDSLRSNYSLQGRSGTQYPTREDAIVARMQSQIPVSRESAELLAERALCETDKGWSWHADQRLKATNAYRITDEMRGDFFKLIQAPTLLIEPEQGLLKLDPRFNNSGSAVPNLTRKSVPGSHHCHMDDCPDMVAELIEDWLTD